MSPFIGDFLFWVRDAASANGVPEDPGSVEWPPLGADAEIRRQELGDEMTLWYRGNVRCRFSADAGGLAIGRSPGWPAAEGRPDADKDPILGHWMQQLRAMPEAAQGQYCYVLWDCKAKRVTAFTDAFRTAPIYFAAVAGHFVCASDLRLILATRVVDKRADLRSLYHYLNFSYIPAPCSPIKGVVKLPAGQVVTGGPGQATTRSYWDAHYPEDFHGSVTALSAELRTRMVGAVRRARPASSTGWGTFLSGGTDSSSIAGILAHYGERGRVKTFSIGFGETEFDELTYARIAAAHFNLDAHMRNVSQDDAVDLLPRLVRVFDEPFGNASAIPTHYCAALAREHGITTLVAGDGGDEIFGGNERYKKDKVLEWYHRSPALVRRSGTLVAKSLKGVDSLLANRIKNFVERGSLPNPDRFYSDDSFASEVFEALLSTDFREHVGREDSLAFQRWIYRQCDARSELHKLMYLDLKMTISDNDIVKVTRAARLAGVGVVFPYLDRELIAYTGRLPDRYKVNRLEKRFLFRRAMNNILPQAILGKTKQGFGLPVSVWLRTPGRFRDLLNDVVFSKRALGRGYFNVDYLRDLLATHQRGTWDYSAEIYRLLMLELWHAAYLDRHG